jgi:hypothetical protein
MKTKFFPFLPNRLFLSTILIVLLFNGCNLIDKIFHKADPIIQQVTASLDFAIGSLNATSSNYQEVLQKLINDLPKEVQSTVTNEVSNLLNRTVAAAGAEVRCDVDFFRIRVQQALQRIKAEYLKQPLPPVEPQLCNVIPLAIDMNLTADRRNKLEFYGYDFDVTAIQVLLVNNNGQIDVSDKLAQPTHYHMVLNLGSNGVPVSDQSTKLVLRWNNRDISSIPIIQKNPPICQTSFFTFQPAEISYMPPLTRGDREFDGNGPDVYSSVNLINTGNSVIARVYMKAVETESDWTTGEGSRDFVIYNADPGKVIESIVTPTFASYSYRDDNHDMDNFAGTGPVFKFHFVGDDDGDDVGVHTRVEIEFTNIRVELKETGDCISSSMIRTLELQNAISPILLNRAKSMKAIKFIAPMDMIDTLNKH